MNRQKPKRRSNQEGSFSLRRDGRWQGRISSQGTRVTVYGRTRDEARKKLRDLQRKQDLGLPLSSTHLLVKDYLQQWLALVRNRLRPKSVSDYESLVRNHLAPHLGRYPLSRLGPEHINRAWDAMLRDGTSPAMVQRCHARLTTALRDAMKLHLLVRNPAQAVTPPRAEKKAIHPPSAMDINKILRAAKDTVYYEVIHTCFHTGLRRNEALALRWRDVDLEDLTLSVGASVYRAKGGKSVYLPPKTARSRRSVALTPASARVLQDLKAQQEEDGRLLGYAVDPDSLIFRDRMGSPILPRSLTRAFTNIMKRAGLKGYRLHDTRHAHATLMLRQGVHPKIVQERLGHSKISTTLDIYSHVVPGLQEAAALRFDEGLQGALEDKAPTPTKGRL
jgi:integrase